MRKASAWVAVGVAAAAGGLFAAGIGAAVDGPSLDFQDRTVVVVNAPAGLERAKFYDTTGTTTYLGQDTTAPFQWTYPASTRAVQVRLVNPDSRLDGTFPTTTPTATVTSSPTTPSANTSPTQPPAGVVTVSTTAELGAALAAAQAGQTIHVTDGTYDRDTGRWLLAADGTPDQPITLTGSAAAQLTNGGPTGDYGLHVTGDHWVIEGITVAQASKGIVLDGAQHALIRGVTVHSIGDEGIHFRWCSSDGVLRDSLVYDTGLRAPRYGEGVYVGSANSNWSKYACTDGRDNSERTLIEGNTFRNITAEGADLKEGTESGVLRGNVFDNTGWSGENSADSAVDAKGNGWLIEGNVVRNASGAFLDAFQTHSVYSGYGQGNVFRGNTVEGPVPGFGFGLYPAGVVACDNSAPGAVKGLVGSNGRLIACGP